MKHFNVITIAAFVVFLFAACNDKNDFLLDGITQNDSTITSEEITKNTSYRISETEAVENLENFLSAMYGKELSKRDIPLKIANISSLRKQKHLSKNYKEEDSLLNQIDIDTLMYSINFSDSMGFALVAADTRTAPIFAISEKGNFNFENVANEQNEGLILFLENAIEKEINDIANYVDTIEIDNNQHISKRRDFLNTWRPLYTPEILLKTRWGQETPYNYYCHGCKTGCVITAMAQILSYYQTIKQITFKDDNKTYSANLDWNQINSDCLNNNGNLSFANAYESSKNIAYLCRYLGLEVKAIYGNSTGAKSTNAIDWFNKNGHLNASPLQSYNDKDIIDALKAQKIIYTRGNRIKYINRTGASSYSAGHAWVIDGYMSAAYRRALYYLVHCNWGWNGTANGYYLINAFNTHNGPLITDTYNKTTTKDELNYQYNIQYSIITNK